jgi:hypothetical protein
MRQARALNRKIIVIFLTGMNGVVEKNGFLVTILQMVKMMP